MSTLMCWPRPSRFRNATASSDEIRPRDLTRSVRARLSPPLRGCGLPMARRATLATGGEGAARMSQLSLFSADLTTPQLADLGGLLAGAGPAGRRRRRRSAVHPARRRLAGPCPVAGMSGPRHPGADRRFGAAHGSPEQTAGIPQQPARSVDAATHGPDAVAGAAGGGLDQGSSQGRAAGRRAHRRVPAVLDARRGPAGRDRLPAQPGSACAGHPRAACRGLCGGRTGRLVAGRPRWRPGSAYRRVSAMFATGRDDRHAAPGSAVRCLSRAWALSRWRGVCAGIGDRRCSAGRCPVNRASNRAVTV